MSFSIEARFAFVVFCSFSDITEYIENMVFRVFLCCRVCDVFPTVDC